VICTKPQNAYFTLMATFLYLSFATLIAAVVINLVVGRLDRMGRSEQGDEIDHRCRWVFPLVYFGLTLGATAFFIASF